MQCWLLISPRLVAITTISHYNHAGTGFSLSEPITPNTRGSEKLSLVNPYVDGPRLIGSIFHVMIVPSLGLGVRGILEVAVPKMVHMRLQRA